MREKFRGPGKQGSDPFSAEKKAQKHLEGKQELKMRCARAATFKEKEAVSVDDMPGRAVVKLVDSVRLGLVYVKFPNALSVQSYPAERVHHLDEKKQSPET